MNMQQLLEAYFDRLWPITRSLTGNGNRETLAILSELVDLEIEEVPSGTPCLDWRVPPEWNIRAAWIKDARGHKLIDFTNNNLHVIGYSLPINTTIMGHELVKHIYSLPDQPEWIPYVTSYYQPRWGFCMTHYDKLRIAPNESYEVYIDSTLDENGSMTVAQALLPGKSNEEILFSTYICHPSMANNELSGPLVTAMLYRELARMPQLHYTYRFVFVPETIGALYMLSRFGAYWRQHLKAGYVITCIGDAGAFTFKRSRVGHSLSDRAAEAVLQNSNHPYQVIPFFPLGSDERQYCSPGFNLPVGSLMRTMYGQYPQYHTSADDKSFISFEAMETSVHKLVEMVQLIENNALYINTMPYGEPQLGRRGLYPTAGTARNKDTFVKAMMWILNYSDGQHDLIDIALKSHLPINDLLQALQVLIEKEIILKPAKQ